MKKICRTSTCARQAMTAGGDEACRAFESMMTMQKIDIAKIDAARKG